MKRNLAVPIGLLASFLFATVEPARSQPCATNAKKVMMCGQGMEGLTVHADAVSPSATLAIGWRRTIDAPRSDLPDPSHVEQHIVRLADGKLLGRTVGRAWNDGEMQSNKIDLVSAWSPDERWVLVADVGQISLVALAIYAVDGTAGTVREHDLLATLRAAAEPKLLARVGKKAFEDYELHLPYRAEIALTKAGKVTLPLKFQIPKQDRYHDFVATFTVSQKEGRIDVSPFAIRFKSK